VKNYSLISFCIFLIWGGLNLQGEAGPPIMLVSALSGSGSARLSGNGAAGDGDLSSDGRYVVFSSWASDLVDLEKAGKLNVFLRDRDLAKTILVSVDAAGSGGGDEASLDASVSTDGRWIVFASLAGNLVSGDTNGAMDIFLRDVLSNRTILVSHDLSGAGSGNGDSSSPTMTPDGRWVVFSSKASNLVANDQNGLEDVFVWDRLSETIELVSVDVAGRASGNGESVSPTITPDGQRVAFLSHASNLSPSPTDRIYEVFVRDRQASLTYWASTNVEALLGKSFAQAAYWCYNPFLSWDGRYVAFKVKGQTLSALADTFGIFRHDLTTGNTDLISPAGNGPFASEEDSNPIISTTGQLVVYAAALKSALGVNPGQVYLWNAATKSNSLISADWQGARPGMGASDYPVLSADSRMVFFQSSATNLIVGEVNGIPQIYVRDLAAGANRLITVNAKGQMATNGSWGGFSVSGDGQIVVADCSDDSIIEGDQNREMDVVLWDLAANRNELISIRDDTVANRSPSGQSSMTPRCISQDARFVVYASLANDLVPGDTNLANDVFVRDVSTGSNYLVSANYQTGQPANASSDYATISADGRYVAFLSNASDLVPRDNNNYADVFLRDLWSGQTKVVTRNRQTGDPSSQPVGRSSAPANPIVTPDGRWVVYLSSAADLVTWPAGFPITAGNVMVYAYDIQAGTNGFAFYPIKPPGSLSWQYVKSFDLSPDGHWVMAQMYMTATPFLIGDLRTKKYYPVELPPGITGFPTVNSLAMDAKGRWVAAVIPMGTTTANMPAFLWDLLSGKLVNYRNRLNSVVSLNLSGNGQLLAYTGIPTASAVPTNRFKQVYVRNLYTGNDDLVSVNYQGNGPGNGDSLSPQISLDGRYVLFRSRASDLCERDQNELTDLFVRDLVQMKTYVMSHHRTTGEPGNSLSAQACWGPDARAVVFESFASDMVTGDKNDSADVFLTRFETDSDNDGLPDVWEQLELGGLQSDLNSDPDQDGMSNQAELVAGTEPSDPTSLIAMRSINPTGESKLAISWQSVSGKTYLVETSFDLIVGSWQSASEPVMARDEVTFVTIDREEKNASGFYRIKLVTTP
jgi:Tol biopolymer transport system component